LDSENTATGAFALFNNNINGVENTANGVCALQNNTTGQFNTAVGWEALAANTMGSLNPACGNAALLNNTTGAGNIASDLGTLAPNGLLSGPIACGTAPVDVIEELSAPGSTVFRFDGTQFIYNWQTTKSWAGGCRTLQVKLSDGTSYYAKFRFK